MLAYFPSPILIWMSFCWGELWLGGFLKLGRFSVYKGSDKRGSESVQLSKTCRAIMSHVVFPHTSETRKFYSWWEQRRRESLDCEKLPHRQEKQKQDPLPLRGRSCMSQMAGWGTFGVFLFSQSRETLWHWRRPGEGSYNSVAVFLSRRPRSAAGCLLTAAYQASNRWRCFSGLSSATVRSNHLYLCINTLWMSYRLTIYMFPNPCL